METSDCKFGGGGHLLAHNSIGEDSVLQFKVGNSYVHYIEETQYTLRPYTVDLFVLCTNVMYVYIYM